MVQVTSRSEAAVSSPVGELYPLMCGQRWLFRLLNKSPELARPVQRIYRLRNSLDTACMLAALRHVVSAHPALRMRLFKIGGGWRQYFPQLEAELSGIVIQDGTPAQRAAYAWDIFANDCAQYLDLRSAPPFIARIIRLDGEHYFGLSLDHIAADDIATDVLERDIGQAYVRELENQPHPVASGTKSFFACLAREASRRANEPHNLQYWLDHLRDHPLDDQVGDYKWVPGEAHHWQIGGQTFEKLRQACRSRKASLSSVVLAAYVRLLSELAGKDELVVNVPVSNRTLAADHDVIANLSMLLHMRFRLAGTKANSSFLIRVRDQLLEAMVHRYYDYDSLSESLAVAAANRGGRIHWVTGCSYVIERYGQSSPHPLFEQRLDNQPGSASNIPEGAFALTCRQKRSEFHFVAEWDFGKWPLQRTDIESRFLELLSSLAETSLSGGTRVR